MADITPSAELVYSDGRSHRFSVYLVRGATTLDTVDVAAQFKRVIGAQFVTMSGGTVAATATAAGTVVTLANTGLTNDAGFLIVIGASS